MGPSVCSGQHFYQDNLEMNVEECLLSLSVHTHIQMSLTADEIT